MEILSLENLLKEVDKDTLNESLYSKDVAELTQIFNSKENLSKILICYYGNYFFSYEHNRYIILSLFNLNEINEKSDIFFNIQYTYYLKAKLDIAKKKWITGSKIVLFFQELLWEKYKYKLEESYLPISISYRKPSYEYINKQFLPELFDYQLDMKNKLINFLNNSNNAIMLQMPTGSGKTRVAVESIINKINKEDSFNIIWLAHSKELCEQAISSFKKVANKKINKRFKIIRFFGSFNIAEYDINKNSIVFTSLQKMHSISNKKLFNYLSNISNLIIFDEAHKLLAKTYLNIVKNIKKNSPEIKLIGLSATPGRHIDKKLENKTLSDEFEANLIKPKYTNTIKTLTERGILSKLKRKTIQGSNEIVYMSQKELNHFTTFNELSSKTLEKLANDQCRNNLIVNEIINEIDKKKQCLVFACSTNHAKILSTMLAMREYKSGFITSDMNSSSRAGSISDFDNKNINVLINYGILSTGFDSPSIESLFITRPTNSIVLYSQMIGRGMRGKKVGGTEFCTIIDVIDNISGFTSNQDIIYNYFNGYWDENI